MTSGFVDLIWNHGSDCATAPEPPIQVHHYSESLVILRQSKCLHFEAPFLYLIFGSDKAVLLDTGATRSAKAFPLQQTVERLMIQRYGRKRRPSIDLIVAHTHGHGDHMAGDGQFLNKPFTELISPAKASEYFGIKTWPQEIGSCELGDRSLAVIPIPGHEGQDLAFYDPKTEILFSGDSLYPGRIYIRNWESFRSSIDRLITFVSDKPLTYILGAHIEISNVPGLDFPVGAKVQENEHPLQLTAPTLRLLQQRLEHLGSQPTLDIQAEFILVPL